MAHLDDAGRFGRAVGLARRRWLELPGVVGVGYGLRETDGRFLDQMAIVAYVREKRPLSALAQGERIPGEFGGYPTDVVTVGWRRERHLRAHDIGFLDMGKLHRERGPEPPAFYRYGRVGEVAVVEAPYAGLPGQDVLDGVAAYHAFRLGGYPDLYDFVTYFVDPGSGLPRGSSYHLGVWNRTRGINYFLGDRHDARSDYGSRRLKAYHEIGWFENQVFLQEVGHMWGAFVLVKHSLEGVAHFDLLMGSGGQGPFHWGRAFDDDHSPMDYDGLDRHAEGEHRVADDDWRYCRLDLYLMGLVPPSEVGALEVWLSGGGHRLGVEGGLHRPGLEDGLHRLGVENVILAHGPRRPSWRGAQKRFKDAFVLVTDGLERGLEFAAEVDAWRRRFAFELMRATGFRMQLDTALERRRWPSVRGVEVRDGVVEWRSTVRCRGWVRTASRAEAFQEHPPDGVRPAVRAKGPLGTRHAYRPVAGERYVELFAETQEGLLGRHAELVAL